MTFISCRFWWCTGCWLSTENSILKGQSLLRYLSIPTGREDGGRTKSSAMCSIVQQLSLMTAEHPCPSEQNLGQLLSRSFIKANKLRGYPLQKRQWLRRANTTAFRYLKICCREKTVCSSGPWWRQQQATVSVMQQRLTSGIRKGSLRTRKTADRDPELSHSVPEGQTGQFSGILQANSQSPCAQFSIVPLFCLDTSTFSDKNCFSTKLPTRSAFTIASE